MIQVGCVSGPSSLVHFSQVRLDRLDQGFPTTGPWTSPCIIRPSFYFQIDFWSTFLLHNVSLISALHLLYSRFFYYYYLHALLRPCHTSWWSSAEQLFYRESVQGAWCGDSPVCLATARLDEATWIRGGGSSKTYSIFSGVMWCSLRELKWRALLTSGLNFFSLCFLLFCKPMSKSPLPFCRH